ncbi:sulfate adenylyltransferase subunit 1 [Sphingobacterium mizutaii NBRC 14946 = DSM 11724]|uniref:sulfate adenylyltransferase n=2 Tax=Sphingobacterium mizutaii TaxID=1010 RepID=A0AAJ5C0E2_9SPHI|nr:GTP-binding protein [Sphingobacterium mizutaii]GEM67422.1 sulfate adenylyltransferase subunit 1 [Sphingobacterium mizutaii NBRC 14946 = DSM 11724]SDL05152.1 sulfate adenylyltransferase subunit 1 [Sphingobacterium mizutaii]SNV50740.1 Bifunctional enzyme CysN/CysC [Sphingobacterium mizutaii]
MNILKFLTAGSVDDGKSTLIGRLLYDTNSILDDQLEAIQKANRKNDDGTIDLAILTDGLKAEREQGITIDVAYKYFQTEKRKFIIADAPGHIQYTRNMVTGASNSDLIIILIDARKGVIEQTKRHSFIAKILGIKKVLVCVNKMDMVDYELAVFENIKTEYLTLANKLGLEDVDFIPVSALKGDNIVQKSQRMPWYHAAPLLTYLEEVEFEELANQGWRFPVQCVVRPQSADLHDYRGYAGRVLGEGLKVGEEVLVLPNGSKSKVKTIEFNNEELPEAHNGSSVIIHLEDDIDISRGDFIVSANHPAKTDKSFEANISWFENKELDLGQIYLLQTHSKVSKIKIPEILFKYDVHTQEPQYDQAIGLNDIGRVLIKSADEIVFDQQKDFPENSRAIIIDPRTNITVAAAIIQ